MSKDEHLRPTLPLGLSEPPMDRAERLYRLALKDYHADDHARAMELVEELLAYVHEGRIAQRARVLRSLMGGDRTSR